jgi:hypothetical protein
MWFWVEFPVVLLGTVLCRFDTYIFLMGDKNGYWKPQPLVVYW